jgi:hypothetical protein
VPGVTSSVLTGVSSVGTGSSVVGIGVNVSVGCSAVAGGVTGVTVDVRLGVSVGLGSGVLVGMKGTHSLLPVFMMVVFRQFAAISASTVIPYVWLMLYRVSPAWTI